MSRYSLETISPVHIGNGSKLNQASFLREGNVVYIVDPDTFTTFLPLNLKNRLIEIAEKGERLNLHKFLPDDVKKRFKNQCFYKIPLFSPPTHNGKYCLFEINEFIKKYNQTYIPGSELKGAFRTAILFHLVQDNFDTIAPQIEELAGVPVKQMIRQGRGLSPAQRKSATERIKEIEKKIQDTLIRGKEKDAKYDILKLLQISDSNPVPAEKSLMAGKTVVLGPRGILGFAIFQELLQTGLKFEISAISIPETIKIGTIANSLGFSDNQKAIFNNIGTIFHIGYNFTKEVIATETEFFKNAPYNKKDGILRQLENIANKNSPQSPVIRIGMGEGVLSHTIWLAIKKKDENLYRKILNLSNAEIFPKSRRLYEDKDGNYYTMGWVKIVRDEGTKP